MKFSEVAAQALTWLQREGRVSYRALKREFALDDGLLEDLKEELCFSHPEIADENGRGLVWTGASPVPSSTFQVSNLQHLTPSTQAEAEECFLKAIEIAQHQQAKSLALRAVMSLARLWQRHGKTVEARPMLVEIYSWFTEGFNTKDLQEAKALLEALT